MAEVPKTQEHLFGGSPEKQTPNPAYCTFVCFVVKLEKI
jgi:hypothetical protein